LALTSLTSGGRSIGIVRLRTEATRVFLCVLCNDVLPQAAVILPQLLTVAVRLAIAVSLHQPPWKQKNPGKETVGAGRVGIYEGGSRFVVEY
jgi:hypothetical protein